MLEVNQLTRHYGDFTAVDNVSFTINKGEIVGLLGHNGAGKTTIMKMISGYLEPDQGTVIVDRIDLAKEPSRVQQGLGYLPENLPVYPEMTVADYLDYAADLKGLKAPEKTKEIRRAIKATDISAKLLAPIATLSRGYKQRVGVAQAILGQPKLLILDEPTNGLDPEQTQHMRQLIRELAQDATVILSTHIMQEVDAICSRVLMLRAGQLVVDEKLAELQRTNHLRIETSLPTEKAEELEGLPGIAGVTYLSNSPSASSDDADHNRIQVFRIELDENADEQTVRASLADSLVKAGHQLTLLQPEIRDLETLFREVNDEHYQQQNQQQKTEGLDDAA